MDRIAFEQQARTWRQKALSVSMNCGAGKDEAEDIAQDVMLRLWQMHDELEQCQQEVMDAQLAAHGFVPVKQEDGTIVYINEQTNYIAYEE